MFVEQIPREHFIRVDDGDVGCPAPPRGFQHGLPVLHFVPLGPVTQDCMDAARLFAITFDSDFVGIVRASVNPNHQLIAPHQRHARRQTQHPGFVSDWHETYELHTNRISPLTTRKWAAQPPTTATLMFPGGTNVKSSSDVPAACQWLGPLP
jgi:hypothetical protein